MKLNIEQEEARVYVVTYTKQSQAVKNDWNSIFMNVMCNNLTFSYCYSVKMKQAGKDANGFYSNYIEFVARDEKEVKAVERVIERYDLNADANTEMIGVVSWLDCYNTLDCDRYIVE